MNIWLISDTHFRHANMYRFVQGDGVTRVRERFASVEDADEWMAEAWNTDVRPEDHIWHLGDMTMDRTPSQAEGFIHFVRRLNGHKRLVLGNHDHFPIHTYASAGIQKIVASHRHAGLIYSHIPLHPMSVASEKVIACVHGHIHAEDSPPGKYVNVCVERTGYRPIALDEVLRLARQRAMMHE